MNKQIDALINAKQRIDILMNSLRVNNHEDLIDELELAVENFQSSLDAELVQLLSIFSDVYSKNIKTNELNKPFQ